MHFNTFLDLELLKNAIQITIEDNPITFASYVENKNEVLWEFSECEIEKVFSFHVCKEPTQLIHEKLSILKTTLSNKKDAPTFSRPVDLNNLENPGFRKLIIEPADFPLMTILFKITPYKKLKGVFHKEFTKIKEGKSIASPILTNMGVIDKELVSEMSFRNNHIS